MIKRIDLRISFASVSVLIRPRYSILYSVINIFHFTQIFYWQHPKLPPIPNFSPLPHAASIKEISLPFELVDSNYLERATQRRPRAKFSPGEMNDSSRGLLFSTFPSFLDEPCQTYSSSSSKTRMKKKTRSSKVASSVAG